MRTHFIALTAVLGLATVVVAGELDREFKGSDDRALATAPKGTNELASKVFAGSELDEESPTQAWHRWGWGWGVRVGWGWGGWGFGYSSWHRPYYGFYGGWGGWPSYFYRPYGSFYSPAYAYGFPSWGYAGYGYRGWGCCCW